MTEKNQEQLTQLLKEVNSGSEDALAQLMPVVYGELRRQRPATCAGNGRTTPCSRPRS